MAKTSMIHFRLDDSRKAMVESRAKAIHKKPAGVFRDFVEFMAELDALGALDGLDYLAEHLAGKSPAEVLAAGINARVAQLVDKEK